MGSLSEQICDAKYCNLHSGVLYKPGNQQEAGARLWIGYCGIYLVSLRNCIRRIGLAMSQS